MQIYWTQDCFEYFHKNTNRMIKCNNKIPFIINWDGELVIEANDYLLHKTETQWTVHSKTPITNAQHILSLLEYCDNKNIPWKNISSGELKQFIAYLAKHQKLKENTIKQKISALENMYSWLESRNYKINNPFNEFGTKTVDMVIKTFSKDSQFQSFEVNKVKDNIIKGLTINDIPTKEEIKKVYSKLNKEDKLKMLFLVETGMRKGEMFQLTIGMLKNMNPSKTGKSYSLHLDASEINIKYNKSRVVIVSENLRMQLMKHILSNNAKKQQLKYLKKHNKQEINECPIFISSQGNMFSEDSLNKSLSKASLLAGINNKEFFITPHKLRHFYASHFIDSKDKSNWNMEQVYMYLSERLGHSSPDTTKSYYVKIVNRVKLQEKIENATEDFITEFLK